MFQNPEQAFGGSKPMLELIETIYAAVQQPALWDDVLGQIAQTIEGESIALFADFSDQRIPLLLAIDKMDPAAWAGFANHYAAINPIMVGCEQKFAVGQTWLSDRAMNDAEFEKTEFYNDFFQRNNMHYSVGLRVTLGAGVANLSCQRSKQGGPFGDRADIVYQTLRPHLTRALTLYRQMETMQARTLGLERALEAHGHAVVGLDASGLVTVSNGPAIAMFEAGTGLRSVRERLFCTIPGENIALQGLLARVLAGGSGGAMLVHGAGKHVLRVVVSPFRGSLPRRARALVALVFLSDSTQLPPSRSETLRALYGLTPTECRVADMLLQGLEMRRVANQLGLTLETARFHTKRVLSKTDTRRQAELIRLMLSLPQQVG